MGTPVGTTVPGTTVPTGPWAQAILVLAYYGLGLCRSLCRVGVNQLTGLCRALRNQLTTSYLASVLK